MITIDSGIIPGSDLPTKGRILLTSSLSFITREYVELPFLFKNPNNTASSALDFMPDDILYKSLQLLIRDHYIPFSGWVEMVDTDIYLAWDNGKDGAYSPTLPIEFEAETVDTDYDTFYKMVQTNSPTLRHSKAPSHHRADGKKVPLIFVKVTRLGPDNQAVVMNMVDGHMIMDGCSYAHFYLNWSALCRQMIKNPELQSLPEDASYELPHPPLFGVPDFGKFRDPENQNYIEQAEDRVDDVGDLPVFLKTLGECNEFKLEIPESIQMTMRDQAHQSGVSFQLHLFAMLVKEDVILQVQKKPEIAGNIATLDIAIDVRSRIGLPANFCSSAAIGCHIKVKVKDILELSTVDIAREIKAKMNSAATPEGICGMLDKYVSLWKSVCKSAGDAYENFGAERFRRIVGVPGFIITSILYFKMGDIDFGSGGPVVIRMPKLPVSGLIVISPQNPSVLGNGIRLDISLPKGCDISDSPVLSKFVVSD